MFLSPRLGLSYLAPQQAQKHVTVNETFRKLDALVQTAATSATVSTEPNTPAEGETYILPATASGAAWSGFAEGSLAVFQDGAWAEINPATGMLAFVSDVASVFAFDGTVWTAVTGRPQLTAPTTFHVDPVAGSDTSSGLAAGSDAFRTIQAAIDRIASIDLSVHDVTIQLAPGVYTEGATVSGPWIGSGKVSLIGDPDNPAATRIEPTVDHCLTTTGVGARLHVDGLELIAPDGTALFAIDGSLLEFDNIIFGACDNRHIRAYGARISGKRSNYQIKGGAIAHISAENMGQVDVFDATIEIINTPNFSSAFIAALIMSLVTASSLSVTGSATGRHYRGDRNSIMSTGGVTLPGNQSGTLSSGAQFL